MGGETSDAGSSGSEDEPALPGNRFRSRKKTSQENKRSRRTITRANHRSQKYRSQWEKLSEFRGWLSPDKYSAYKAHCRFCDSVMSSELTVIKRHGQSAKHLERVTDIRPEVQKTVEAFIAPVDTKVQRAEIQLCGFLVSHDIPFSAMDHLCEVLKNAITDSKIIQSFKLKRTKATEVIKNVVGDTQKEKLIEKLKHRKFSIMTDESTDIAAIKTSCIVVRFYDNEAGRIVSQFWDLAQVFGNDKLTSADTIISATAEHLFAIILESFDKHRIPRQNIIGFGSDGCNTMMGRNNSVASRFRTVCPGITIMKCLCHSLHLCASEACKLLPRICEDLARNIYHYFKNSSKRQSKLVQFQLFLSLDVHKILHPSQTRWLSLVIVVDRIIEQWNALRLFFDDEYLNERLMAVEEIHKQLHNPFVKGYYIFLRWALPKFTNLNKYFQSESVVITSMHTRLVFAYKDLLGCYMNRGYVAKTALQDVNPAASEEFVPIPNLYLGVAVMKQMEVEEVMRHPDLITDFKMRCRDFLSAGCMQIRKRYDFGDPLLSLITVLTPEKVLASPGTDVITSIIPLTIQLPRISPTDDLQLQRLDDEWRQMPPIKFPKEITTESEVDIFWDKVSKYKDSTDEPYLTILPFFALEALSIPHSNAQCERVFSKVNLIKTKNRNRLITSTITSALLTSECIRGPQQKQCCHSFEPTNTMLRRMTAANLYANKRTEETITTEDEDYSFSMENV